MKVLVFLFSLTLPMMAFSAEKLCSDPAALQQRILAALPGLQRALLMVHEMQSRLGDERRATWTATYIDPLDRGDSSITGSTEKPDQSAFQNEVIQYVRALFTGLVPVSNGDYHGPPNQFLKDPAFPRAWIVKELFSEGSRPGAKTVLWILSDDSSKHDLLHSAYLGKWNIRDNSVSEEFTLQIRENGDIRTVSAATLEEALAAACEQSKTFSDLQTFQ